MTTFLNGFHGGLIVGLLAATAAVFVSDGPLFGASMVANGSGDPIEPSRWPAFLALVGYGVLAGDAFVIVELLVVQSLAAPPTRAEALVAAAVWSGALLTVATAVWRVRLGRALDRDSYGSVVAYHVVFAVAFGLWIRLTWIT